MKSTNHLILIGLLSVFTASSCGGKNTDSPAKSAPEPQKIEKTVETAPAKIIAPVETKTASVDRGAALYKRCKTCHTLDKDGRHKVGPNLYGVFGANIAAKEGFNYSKAFKASDIVWTDENLAAYIDKPRTFIPGNKMTFVGLRKAEDIEVLLDYMRREMSEE